MAASFLFIFKGISVAGALRIALACSVKEPIEMFQPKSLRLLSTALALQLLLPPAWAQSVELGVADNTSAAPENFDRVEDFKKLLATITELRVLAKNAARYNVENPWSLFERVHRIEELVIHEKIGLEQLLRSVDPKTLSPLEWEKLQSHVAFYSFLIESLALLKAQHSLLDWQNDFQTWILRFDLLVPPAVMKGLDRLFPYTRTRTGQRFRLFEVDWSQRNLRPNAPNFVRFGLNPSFLFGASLGAELLSHGSQEKLHTLYQFLAINQLFESLKLTRFFQNLPPPTNFELSPDFRQKVEALSLFPVKIRQETLEQKRQSLLRWIQLRLEDENPSLPLFADFSHMEKIAEVLNNKEIAVALESDFLEKAPALRLKTFALLLEQGSFPLQELSNSEIRTLLLSHVASAQMEAHQWILNEVLKEKTLEEEDKAALRKMYQERRFSYLKEVQQSEHLSLDLEDYRHWKLQNEHKAREQYLHKLYVAAWSVYNSAHGSKIQPALLYRIKQADMEALQLSSRLAKAAEGLRDSKSMEDAAAWHQEVEDRLEKRKKDLEGDFQFFPSKPGLDSSITKTLRKNLEEEQKTWQQIAKLFYIEKIRDSSPLFRTPGSVLNGSDLKSYRQLTQEKHLGDFPVLQAKVYHQGERKALYRLLVALNQNSPRLRSPAESSYWVEQGLLEIEKNIFSLKEKILKSHSLEDLQEIYLSPQMASLVSLTFPEYSVIHRAFVSETQLDGFYRRFVGRTVDRASFVVFIPLILMMLTRFGSKKIAPSKGIGERLSPTIETWSRSIGGFFIGLWASNWVVERSMMVSQSGLGFDLQLTRQKNFEDLERLFVSSAQSNFLLDKKYYDSIRSQYQQAVSQSYIWLTVDALLLTWIGRGFFKAKKSHQPPELPPDAQKEGALLKR